MTPLLRLLLPLFPFAVALGATSGAAVPPSPPSPLRGDADAVRLLLDRVLPPGGSSRFDLALLAPDDDGRHPRDCAPGVAPPCFALSDSPDGSRTAVLGTTASELTAGIGHYLREYCNMTIGWARGGGSNVYLPSTWPSVGPAPGVARRRVAPHSYLMNVCAHSYSLAWYSWSDWEAFIDWMALSGVNMMLALTGQEEIQYKVFRELGLNDTTIRAWFNGPALLAWSRGQNEYGAGMLGPLPRSWMRTQWELQRRILPRLRSLGIVGQLPGFQGNVPVQLRAVLNDTNITAAGATGWMDSLDPLFGKIADLWMKTLIDDFGTDHWYQLDGYFDGGTAPWMVSRRQNDPRPITDQHAPIVNNRAVGTKFPDVPRDAMAYRRASSAYMGLNRTDPHAVWSFQGWAVHGWSKPEEAAVLKAFVESVPSKDKFVVVDMEVDGSGQWRMFDESAFFGANFIWTSLHDFGGVDGIKGNLSKANRIPFDAPPEVRSNVVGTGATPEGIDQNPAYYEFLFAGHFRDRPVENVTEHMIRRSHRRYGLSEYDDNIAMAWSLLTEGMYSVDVGVQDGFGVAHLPAITGWGRHSTPYWPFQEDRVTPEPVLCSTFRAWTHLIDAAVEGSDSSSSNYKSEPFLYDLVNTGREVLASITNPASLNFSDAFSRPAMGKDELTAAGQFYIHLLHDVDALVGTDSAFLLGPWLESARAHGRGHTDCEAPVLDHDVSCENFMEWNARTQLTTWTPTPQNATKVPSGPVDYAAKHWHGLVRDYYGRRAELVLEQALRDAATATAGRGGRLNATEMERIKARHAYEWTTTAGEYPVSPVGDALEVSVAMRDKYGSWFASCGGGGSTARAAGSSEGIILGSVA